MNFLRAARQNEELHGDIVLDAYHQRVCQGNKRLHLSERGLDQRHWDGQ
jgi:hypothetical protein